jgi:hypothetical protein
MASSVSRSNFNEFEVSFEKLRKNGLLALSCLSVCLSVRMEQLGCHWTDFHEIWYWNIFRKQLHKFKVS